MGVGGNVTGHQSNLCAANLDRDSEAVIHVKKNPRTIVNRKSGPTDTHFLSVAFRDTLGPQSLGSDSDVEVDQIIVFKLQLPCDALGKRYTKMRVFASKINR
eukprot:m.65534 g.65534  ORF g.65534 m.65534 type:complete len:102 (-) comp9767_c2_seq1:3062-3367(-)